MSECRIENILEKIEMFEAYKRITEEHGPSEQLLAFINYDGALASEIGLETFDSLSLQARHEIFLNSVDCDTFEILAVEGLAEKIDNITNWAIGLGIGGMGLGLMLDSRNKYSILTVLPGLLAFLGGTIIKNVNIEMNGVISYINYKKLQDEFNLRFSQELRRYERIPANFDPKAWSKYYTDLVSEVENSKIHKVTVRDAHGNESEHDRMEAIFESKSIQGIATWDEADFKKAVSWTKEAHEKLDNHLVTYLKKLAKIKVWLTENKYNRDPLNRTVYNLINKTITYNSHNVADLEKFLNRTTHALDNVSKLFSVKK